MEAMASGLPVVSTTVGVEGLDLDESCGVIVVDTRAAWLSACERLVVDERYNEDLGRRARAYALRHFHYETHADTVVRAHE
jgi:glycosyltransferase involved in cell wall biosynthesis